MTHQQAKLFYASEGDEWFRRNIKKLPVKDDPVMEILTSIQEFAPQKVLEVGCSNGWRLAALKNHYKCECWGIDTSHEAVEESRKLGILTSNGVAHDLPYVPGAFDTVIFGFVLYLCDREDLFQIVKEADRVLAEDGYLIVHDFDAISPCKTEYKHKEGVWSYKYNYSKFFMANPSYSLVASGIFGKKLRTRTVVLRKNTEKGWPCV